MMVVAGTIGGILDSPAAARTPRTPRIT